MRRVLFIAVILLAGYGGFRLWHWWFPSDEEEVRRVLEEAAETASWSPGQGGIARLARMEKLTRLCTPDIEIVVNAPGGRTGTVRGTTELQQALMATRFEPTGFQIRLRDISVELGVDGAGAVAQLIAMAEPSQPGGEPIVEEVRVTLVRDGGAWRVQRVEPVRGFGM